MVNYDLCDPLYPRPCGRCDFPDLGVTMFDYLLAGFIFAYFIWAVLFWIKYLYEKLKL